MTPQEIAARLTAIHTALVEKTGEQPFLAPDLTVSQGGKCRIDINKAYGNVIDEGHALNLTTDVMGPLGAASQAMTKNLIVKEAVK
jgi:hypothetical protein